ncbi:MAG: HDIG domain-containing protein [Litorilinea sp.]|nr:MAG: HDIG domain-containing protein [Litorilinea sp.]
MIHPLSASLHGPWYRRAAYRIGQFWRGFRARVQPAELDQARALLPPDAARLFLRMPRDAQRHSLNVWSTLQDAGYRHPDLAVAALLHDVGKLAAEEAGLRLGLWLRGPLVLLEAWAPALLARWASPDPRQGWRYLLHVHRAHPAIGAAWARTAGCSDLACWLIAHHQTWPVEASSEVLELLAALRWADSQH